MRSTGFGGTPLKDGTPERSVIVVSLFVAGVAVRGTGCLSCFRP